MNSPLQGGRKRGLGWDGPWLARRPRRRPGPRRLAALAIGLVAGVGTWLVLGTDELADAPPLSAAGVVPPGTERMLPDVADAARAARAPRSRAEAVALSLAVGSPLRVELEKPPAAGLVFDLDSGETLWRRSPTDERPIASLTKIMTTLLVAEELDHPGRKLRVGRESVGSAGTGGVLGSAIGLEPGMRVKRGALFQAMMIASANDASTALAVDDAGSAQRFVRRMNRRARRLELDCTRFVSPHGFEPGNRSCAADLAALTRVALVEPRVARVARRKRTVVEFPIEGGKRHLATTNPLLQAGYPGTVGLKTGFTQEAGASIVAVARREGRTLGVVLLDSPSVERQAAELFDAAFEHRRSRRGRTGGSGASGGQGSADAERTSGGPASSGSSR